MKYLAPGTLIGTIGGLCLGVAVRKAVETVVEQSLLIGGFGAAGAIGGALVAYGFFRLAEQKGEDQVKNKETDPIISASAPIINL